MAFFAHHNHTRRGGLVALLLGVGAGLALSAPISAFAQQASFGLGLGSGREAIQIDADAMEMRDKEGIAIFSGDVSVIQGERLLRAGKMIVHYEKPDSQSDGAAQRDAGSGGGLGSTGIERLEVSSKVYVKSGTQIATGDAGVFDAKTNILVMTGEKVVLVDGNNVATGCKLTAHMDTGRAFLESCPSSSRGGRVSIIMNRD